MSLILDEHRHYLADRARVERYAAALREVVRPGDVVVDLASGTGILGLLAWRAGAARVYAVEVTPVAGVARRVAAANGCGAALHVIHGPSSDARLPEPADVIVSDQIGRFGFDAGLLSLFADARARMLKPGGRVVPSALELVVAPVEHGRQYARVAFWRRRPAGFDFTPIAAMASNTAYPTRLGPRHLLAEPRAALRVDLAATTPDALRVDASFTAARDGRIDGVGGWFAAQLSPSIVVTNSPLDRHRILRRQAFMPIETPVDVARGDGIDVAIRILPDALVLSWDVTIRRAAQPPVTFRHATLKGMLLDAGDLRTSDPSYRPVLSARGVARRSVLELCDGRRTLAEIEAEIFTRHADLFASRAEAVVFVGEVVTRYTRDAP